MPCKHRMACLSPMLRGAHWSWRLLYGLGCVISYSGEKDLSPHSADPCMRRRQAATHHHRGCGPRFAEPACRGSASGGRRASAGGDHCGAGAVARGGQPRRRLPRRLQQGHLHPLPGQRPGALRGAAGGPAGVACAPVLPRKH